MRVSTERVGRVLLMRMERAAKRNAIDAEMTAALDSALNDLDDDPDLWAGVLAGTAVAFSAGTDLVSGAGAPTERGGNYGVGRPGGPLAAGRACSLGLVNRLVDPGAAGAGALEGGGKLRANEPLAQPAT